MARKSRILSGLRIVTGDSSSENQTINAPSQPQIQPRQAVESSNQTTTASSQPQIQPRQAGESRNKTTSASSLPQMPLDQAAISSTPQANQDAPPIIEHESTEIIDNVGRRYRKRGRTTMASVWNLSGGEKIFVQVNKFGVPCTQEAAILGSFLGTIATNGTLAPVNFSRWDDKLMKPFYRKMLVIVEEKFEFPPETRKWVLQSINKKWRDHKSDLKSRNFLSDKTMEQIESSIPEEIVPSQWPTLVQSWFTETSQRVSAKNTMNALQNKHSHTSGRMSYARRRKAMEKEGKSPDRLIFLMSLIRRKMELMWMTALKI
ncbi:uncharacterized protein LOC126680406 isoform X1 [Mercurialis annua]|uniref:uncharacterized protein LOC126680406 isoform X1 n=1 Tax=Mercurialis annua TaxID=3986 RepID=UPI0024ACADB8|nr:uncharacterized protein LOC126680406 isoform X1 [Mercurialis annua]XP_055961655.1 uncharacterized protein LOC126680406 isoform X1 [Mercurialis annua]